MQSLRSVALGDIFVDYICDLEASAFDNIAEVVDSYLSANDLAELDIFGPLHVEIGGAGIQFAVAAKMMGFAISSLIGKIGGTGGEMPDLPGASAIAYLERQDIEYQLKIDQNAHTGRVMILYFRQGRRLMISDSSANLTFSTEDISPSMIERLQAADLIHVSGYTLLQPERREAIIELLKKAKEKPCLVALDVVPHGFYKHMSFDRLLDITRGLVDWIIIEICGAHQLVGRGYLDRRDITSTVINDLIRTLSSQFLSVALSINNDEFAVFHQGICSTFVPVKNHFKPGVEARGYSARVQAELLFHYMTQPVKGESNWK